MEEAGSGAVPAIWAKAALDLILRTSPTSPRIMAAMRGPIPVIEVRVVPDSASVDSMVALVRASSPSRRRSSWSRPLARSARTE